MRKKRKVPEVLWRLFRDGAQTLGNTLTSLIPHSSFCQCNTQSQSTCLQNAMSFLLQPNDPPNYRKLLNHCFVVLNDKSPPISEFHPHNRWPQHQIVERTIEMIMRQKPKSTNVICSEYNKTNNSSPIVELLTCSAWNLLLNRVGDDIMIYLLKNASIFLPLPYKKHQQVAGLPVSDLVFKSLKRTAEPNGSGKKRDRVDNAESMSKRQRLNSPCVDSPIRSVSCIGCNHDSYMRTFSGHAPNKYGQISFSKVAAPKTGAGTVAYERHSIEEPNGLNQMVVKPRKRSRPFRWQRWRKRRHLDIIETSDCTGESSSAGRLLHGIDNDLSHCYEKMPQRCYCCLVFQAPNLIAKGAYINRQPMFYNLEHFSSVLPQKHVLNSLKPNVAGSNSLFGSIFGLSDVNVSAPSMPCSHSSGFCRIGSACLYHSLAKLLKILIRQIQRCKHLRLLDKHCMQNSSAMFEGNNLEREASKKSHGVGTEHGNEALVTIDPQIEAAKSYCSKSQVVSFIWAVCRNLVPSDLLGNPSNWRILRKNISKFIWLRRFERFSLNQCMHKLKTSGFPFLSDKHSLCCLDAQVLNNLPGQTVRLNDAAHNLKHIILEKWIFWFFSCLVVSLLQANFYVTESEHGKQDIYFYRKSIWEKLRNRAIACLKDQNYQQLGASDVKGIISNRSFGFSKLRLRPKANGVRMLANLQASSRMPAQKSSSQVLSIGKQKKAQFCCKPIKFEYFKSVNCVLRDTYAVLKGLKLKEPEKLGSSVFDYNDIYGRLCPFIIGLKNELTAMPEVFVVVSDVSSAFDSIDQDKLLDVMKDVITEDEYLLKQSYQVVCTKKSLWLHENLILTYPNISTGFTRFSSSLLFGSLHTVLVNKGYIKYLKKEELLFNLTEHVKSNVLQFNKKFYLQGLGIPQGSILSSLLCSLYYGHLERNVIFPFLEKAREAVIEDLSNIRKCQDAHAAGKSSEDKVISSPRYLLLRLIDDFLFISTSKKDASNFFSRLWRGFRAYNCYMNENKFCLNFDIGQVLGLTSNRVFVGEDGISFLRWSGLLLNSCTLEVQADYTRYLNNHLSSSLTVCWQGKPGHQLKMKLCDFMRPKCHPIFFDSNINSASVVRLNIYQAFLLCAMKFHCYVSDMSYMCKLCPKSYLKGIKRSFRYMYVLIKKRMRSVHLGSYVHPVLQLEEGEVEWLGLNAYIQVLKRKQSRHKELLSLLRLKLSAHATGRSLSTELKYAVDSSHSSLFWKIKY